ncbi:MAG TPA: hypothetical protein VMV29_02110 [Ktedonobacterales bacterium]|nr:hypothetical protein [Ktedonobacterales bacterium]
MAKDDQEETLGDPTLGMLHALQTAEALGAAKASAFASVLAPTGPARPVARLATAPPRSFPTERPPEYGWWQGMELTLGSWSAV